MTTQHKAHVAPAELSGHHKRTYEALFRHPMSHNIEWHDVLSLLGALAEVDETSKGTLKITRNGEHLTLREPSHKELSDVDEIQKIRHFLDRSTSTILPPPIPAGAQLLVVIDHHQAKVYSTQTEGSVPHLIIPEDPQGHGKHLHSESPETAGKRAPERKSFYEAIAKTLRGAEEILVLGTGTGESSAMDHLVAELRHHHHDVANCIVGTVVIDEHHTTEAQHLAKARGFFASR